MIVGFNHNVNYRGVGFHVQTEDSGPKNPQLVTLLYHEGIIIASQKTLYADILKVDNLDQVVEDLAKEQHKGMLRRLTKGEFDQRIIDQGIPLEPASGGKPEAPPPVKAPAKPGPSPAPKPEKKPLPSPDAKAQIVTEPITLVDPEPVPIKKMDKIVEEPVVDKFRKPKPSKERTLDDLIYAYLTGSDE